MRLVTVDTFATKQALRDNLQNLGTFLAIVNGNISKIHGEFDKNYSQLIAQGTTLDNPTGILFKAYNIVPCTYFKKYIGHMKTTLTRDTSCWRPEESVQLQLQLVRNESII
jgi:hypothetical protein